ncbi:valine--tRNA ligase [uncultured Sulfitobacter sp.]|uniref:valine--tRNA ligase n=1 Tax=uncultured Sulfitobacter sp. TaxID=191468 RepID=UPI0030F7591A
MALDKNFDAAKAEARLYEAWETAGAFKAGANASRDDTYCVMIPPPNVNGSLHVGHAFNNTLQDILVRWHRMRGFDTLWQPGQDHAGIALQLAVENKLAESQIKRTDLTREEFLGHAWAYKEATADTIVGQLKRLGSSCDWSRNAFTMSGAPGDTRVGHENSPNFHDAVIKVFVDMYNAGKIYRGKRLVNWDPRFETAISDLEVENIEVPGHMWHFKYPLAGGATYEYVEKDEDGNETLRETRDYIAIATTRPETMLGDGAVAVHPSDERYAPIIGKLCEIPVGPKEHRRLIPIITDEYPDKDFGSGAVKITGAHDFNDYQVAKRNGIPMYNLMDTKAAMRADGKPYAEEAATAQKIANGELEFDEAMIAAMNLVPEDYRGLDRLKARKKVVEAITAEGLAVMTENPRRVGDNPPDEAENEEPALIPYVENKPIMQPFGDRSKVVIEPMLTDQWFVDTDQIVGPALDAVRNGDVKIMPESGEKTYYNWLDNIEPWCISRQLWWGHQIPVWYGPTKEELLSTPKNTSGTAHNIRTYKEFVGASLEAVKAKAEEYYGDNVDVGYYFDGMDESREVSDRQPAYRYGNATYPLYGPDKEKFFSDGFYVQLTRDPDVLDTWFSSGLWPIGTLGWPEETEAYKKYFPTSDLITGQDILFFWVARMMMMQLDTVGRIPFDTVYLHGLVRDAKGKKMSKSVGNVIDPLEIIDEYGADALRFTNAAMASLGGALKLDTARIAGYRNFGTKIWNAHRFAEMNGVFEDNVPAVNYTSHADVDHTLNKWIIGETARVREEVDAALENYRFNDAANALYAFVWGKVCDWYVELSKPLLQDDAPEAAETRQTLKWVLDQCLTLLHPIMPFITEELWQNTDARSKMLIHGDWPTYTVADMLDADADRELNWVIGLIESIRSARQQMHVPAGLKVPMLCTSMDDAAQAAWDGNEAMIKRLARVESIEKTDDFPKGTVSIAAPGATFGLPLAGLIDIDAEKSRLQKSLDKLGKEIGGLKGRLNNPKFAASAPAEVVAEAQGNLDARQEEADQLQAALDRLAELG